MRAKIIISKDTAKAVGYELINLFPKLDKEPEYSIGFQLWSKLTKVKRSALMVTHGFDYQAVLNHLETL